MSERCVIHGWAHAYKLCPKCQPMNEGKQEAREDWDFLVAKWLVSQPGDFYWNQQKVIEFAQWCAASQANQPQDICAWCGGGNPAVCHKCMQKEIAVARTEAHCAGQQYGFQRGQQAMAEKAAQLVDLHFDCGPMQLVQEIRSLASAEPPQGEVNSRSQQKRIAALKGEPYPQGEAEKEGRG